VKTSSNAGTLERLIGGILLTGSDQAWHLILGELDFLTAKGSQTQVCDLQKAKNQYM